MGSLGGMKSTIDYSVVENKAEQTQAVNPVSMESMFYCYCGSMGSNELLVQYTYVYSLHI